MITYDVLNFKIILTMTFITKDVTSPEWVAKKQFYKAIWMEDYETWEMVQVRQWDWEFTKSDLEDIKANIEKQLIEVNDKLSYFN